MAGMDGFVREISVAREAAEEWEAVDFDTLRLALDEQAEGFARAIDERTQARRSLTSLAKALRQDAVNASTQDGPPLPVPRLDEVIRGFKSEVDHTLIRAKAAEAAFLSLYRMLSRPNLVDPTNAIRRLAVAAEEAVQAKAAPQCPVSTPGHGTPEGMEAKAEVVLARLAEVGLTPGSAHAVDSGSAVAALERIFDDERTAARQEAERSMLQRMEGERAALLAACDDRISEATAAAEQRAHSLEAQLSLVASREQEGSAAAVEVAEAAAVAAQSSLAQANHRSSELESQLSQLGIKLEEAEGRLVVATDASARAERESRQWEGEAKARLAELEAVHRRLAGIEDEAVSGKWKKLVEQAEDRLEIEETTRREVEGKCGQLQQELVAKGELIARLENDLVAAHQVVEAGKVMLRSFQQKIPSSVPPGTDVLAPQAAAKPSAEGSALPQYIGGFGSADRVLEAVQAQKERLRKTLLEREGELGLAKSINEQLSAEAAQLRNENMQLFRKIRRLSVAGDGLGGSAVEAK